MNTLIVAAFCYFIIAVGMIGIAFIVRPKAYIEPKPKRIQDREKIQDKLNQKHTLICSINMVKNNEQCSCKEGYE